MSPAPETRLTNPSPCVSVACGCQATPPTRSAWPVEETVLLRGTGRKPVDLLTTQRSYGGACRNVPYFDSTRPTAGGKYFAIGGEADL